MRSKRAVENSSMVKGRSRAGSDTLEVMEEEETRTSRGGGIDVVERILQYSSETSFKDARTCRERAVNGCSCWLHLRIPLTTRHMRVRGCLALSVAQKLLQRCWRNLFRCRLTCLCARREARKSSMLLLRNAFRSARLRMAHSLWYSGSYFGISRRLVTLRVFYRRQDAIASTSSPSLV